MVNRGKPSQACHRCRMKRTKCDMKTPSCTQCLRAGSNCPGYRDAISMAFRDETNKFYKENQCHTWPLQTSSSTLQPTSTSSLESSLVVISQRAGDVISIPGTSLSTSMEEQSICFFFHNWIVNVGHASQFGLPIEHYLEEIPNKLRDHSCNVLLRRTVICLGKAGLAIHQGSVATKAAAEADYAVALRLTNKALSDMVEAKSDQTLITVMLLGLYEVSTSRRKESLHSWTKHVNGVAALLQLRGIQQFNNSFSLRLFSTARAQLITNYMHRRVTVPDFFTETIPSDDAFDTDAERCTNRLAKIGMRFCNIRARLTKTDWPADKDEQESSNVIPILLSLESDLESWARSSSEDFHFSTVPVDRPTENEFLNYYHVYSNMYSSAIWNNYRSIRMHINIMLKRRLILTPSVMLPNTGVKEGLKHSYHEQIFKCRMILDQLALDICASVPFFLGLNGFEENTLQNLTKESSFGALSAHRLVWPLWTAGVILGRANPMRIWIIKLLAKIADLTGFQQAALMSQALSDGIRW